MSFAISYLSLSRESVDFFTAAFCCFMKSLMRLFVYFDICLDFSINDIINSWCYFPNSDPFWWPILERSSLDLGDNL